MKRILYILLFLPLFANGQFLINSYRYASGGGAPSMPTTNMRYWHAADNGITQSSNNISAVDDKGSSNRDLAQGTGANQPNWVSSNQILYNGTSDYLNLSYAQPQVLNLYMVVSFTSNGAVPLAGDLETVYIGREANDKISISTNFGGDVFQSTTTAPNEGTKYLIHFVINDASSSITINNGSAETGDINFSGNLTNPYTFGAVTFSGSPIVYGGYTMWEQVAFGSQTSGQIADVKTVLNTKYSIW